MLEKANEKRSLERIVCGTGLKKKHKKTVKKDLEIKDLEAMLQSTEKKEDIDQETLISLLDRPAFMGEAFAMRGKGYEVAMHEESRIVGGI